MEERIRLIDDPSDLQFSLEKGEDRFVGENSSKEKENCSVSVFLFGWMLFSPAPLACSADKWVYRAPSHY